MFPVKITSERRRPKNMGVKKPGREIHKGKQQNESWETSLKEQLGGKKLKCKLRDLPVVAVNYLEAKDKGRVGQPRN